MANKFTINKLYILNNNQSLFVKSYRHGIVWLLNKEKEVSDTIQFMNRNNCSLHDIVITGRKSFSINSLQGTASYKVENNKIIFIEGLYIHPDRKAVGYNKINYQDIENPIHATLIKKQLFVLDMSFKTTPGIYALEGNKKYKIASKQKYKNYGLTSRERQMQGGFANRYLGTNWKYIVNKDKVFINSASANKCYIFDINTKKTKILNFPTLLKEDKAFWFYMYDHIQNKNYAFKLMKKKKNEVYTLDIETGNMKLIAKTEHKIEDIVNGKMQIMKYFEGVCSHFLVPFNAKDFKQKHVVVEEVIIN